MFKLVNPCENVLFVENQRGSINDILQYIQN